MFVSKPLITAKLPTEVRVFVSSDTSSTMSPTARRSEIAAILAAGVVRHKSRVAIADLVDSDKSWELSKTCLELPSESVLSVTNVVNDR